MPEKLLPTGRGAPLVPSAARWQCDRQLCQDIFSCAKAGSHDFHNLVIVIEREEGLTREEACAKAAHIHDLQVAHFMGLERRLPAFDAETERNLRRYVKGIRTWLRASHGWSGCTPRYNVG